MSFHSPTFLWLILAVIPVTGLWFVLHRRAARGTERFAERATWHVLNRSVSQAGRRWKAITVFCALLFAIVAAARPLWGTRERVLRERGVDLIVGIDVSRSMLARDVQEGANDADAQSASRLEAAKKQVDLLLGYLPGHRVGVMPFAGEAFLQCPLTSDYSIAARVLEEISPSTIPVAGTNLARALEVANNSFESSALGTPVLLLITDGEDHEGGVEEQLERARDLGVRIFALGIGSEEGTIVQYRTTSGLETLHDSEGKTVLSRLDVETLRSLAGKTGGQAWISRPGERLDIRPVSDALTELEQGDIGRNEKRRLVREERFQIPLAFALALLLAEGFISERKRTTRQRKTVA